MSYSPARLCLAKFALLGFAWIPLSCSRPAAAPSGGDRVAILPFENLTGDASLDWTGSAIEHAVREQLAGIRGLRVAAVARASDALGVGATRLVDGYLTREHGRLRLAARVTGVESNGPAADIRADGSDPLELAGKVALALSPQAHPYPTRNAAALKAFTEGRYEEAAHLDPGYGLAYTTWANTLASKGDREGVLRAVAAATAQGDRIPPADRERLAYVAATLQGDSKGQLNALAALAKLAPGDIDVLRRLGGLALRARRFSAAADWFRKATAVDPANGVLWNDLGYALAYARNPEGAFSALREYAKTAPGQPNPSDSSGEVAFYFGRFEEADRDFQEAWKRNPGFLNGAPMLKAAYSRLMLGDLDGADQRFSQYLARPDDYKRAQWEYLTGRRPQAMARLRARPPADSLARTQLAFWALGSGDLNGARELAASASARQNSALAYVARFLAQPSAPASEWRARAAAAFASAPGIQAVALSYALLLDRHFPEAAVELRKLFDETPPETAGPVKVLLAWALIESGKTGEARDYLDTWPVPLLGVQPEVEFLTFPRIFRLRAAVLESEGKKQEADAALALYRKYGGE